MTTPAPQEWLDAARGGDAAAWGALLGHYRPYLLLLAAVQLGRRLRVKAEPEDVVQEALLQAHRCFPKFRGASEAAFLDWLQAVLASRLAKLVRRYCGCDARDIDLERDLAAAVADSSRRLDRALVAGGSSPSGRAAAREEAVRVAAAIGHLADDHRRVIVLRQMEGLPFAAVADRMGRTEDAVTQLWVRAIRDLRGRLGVGA